MAASRRRDGFDGEKQIDIPTSVLDKHFRGSEIQNALFLTHIGFYPKASFHYRERKKGCNANILFYCLDGKGYYDTHKGSFELTANQFAILPAGHFHRYQADINEPWTIHWVHFSGKKLRELNNFLGIEQFIAPTPIKYNEKIIEAWEEMYNALKSGYTLKNVSHSSFCLYRFISLFVFGESKPEIAEEDDPIIESTYFLKANIDKIFSIDEIACRFSYSASHFSKLFRTRTGYSPLEYFIKLKMHHACQLLDQSNFKIKEIAAKLGYEDPYYFSRQFCKTVGVSPAIYRENKIK